MNFYLFYFLKDNVFKISCLVQYENGDVTKKFLQILIKKFINEVFN